MTDDLTVGSLASELRALAEVLAEKSGGAENLVDVIRGQLNPDEPGDEPLSERVEIR